ncbi:hypothetical protein AMTRI_Chr02g260380 [Amborella trichopoda]
MDTQSPDELRRQAQEEKKKYGILKKEGKSDEALRAFKRGKELERQADALDIASRKSRKKASSFSNRASNEKTDGSVNSTSGTKLSSGRVKEEKNDLASELKSLGWSDADLHNGDKKPKNLSFEGELSNLLGEVPQKSSFGQESSGIEKSQVLAHKRKALVLKREGKLAEAKEELKKAKVLEKQLEEQEFFGQDEESDDEIAALIRSINAEQEDDLPTNIEHHSGFDFTQIQDIGDDVALEVTDHDLNDPDIVAALKSFGWGEEMDETDTSACDTAPKDREALKAEVLSLKREALRLKRAGNASEAREILKKAKLLEKDLENLQSQQGDGLGAYEETITTASLTKKKSDIQRELLGLKRRALALRKEGLVDEAEAELRKGKVLEQELEEMENNSSRTTEVRFNTKGLKQGNTGIPAGDLSARVDEDDADVSEQDMHDPALLSLLTILGWKDDDQPGISNSETGNVRIEGKDSDSSEMMKNPRVPKESSEKIYIDVEYSAIISPVISFRPVRSKANVQKELLGIKRKALALRRQGKSDEADEELQKAKVLEAEMEEIESSQKTQVLGKKDTDLKVENQGSVPIANKEEQGKKVAEGGISDDISYSVNMDLTENQALTSKVTDTQSVQILDLLSGDAYTTNNLNSAPIILPNDNHSVHHDASEFIVETQGPSSKPAEILKSVVHVSEKLSTPNERGEQFVQAMESSLIHEEDAANERREKLAEPMERKHVHEADASIETSAPKISLAVPSDRNSSQLAVLAHKKNALALKKEGKLAEAKEELRQAKLLEKSIETGQVANTTPSVSTSDDISNIKEEKQNQPRRPISSRDRFKLQQASLAHKRQALRLRREGRIEESEAEFELAKSLEAQMEEIDGCGLEADKHGANDVEAGDEAIVDDLLDPQLLSALQAIGWNDAHTFSKNPNNSSEAEVKAPSKPHAIRISSIGAKGNSSVERANLEEKMKAERMQAFNLKRAGRQPEALEALRRAKQFEKRLNQLSS